MRAARNPDDRPRIGERPPGASRVRPALVPANPRIVVGTFGGDYARLMTKNIPLYISGFAMPKNAPNKEGAYAYLDAMLAPHAQCAFAKDLGYNPTVTNAALPSDLERRIGFTPDERRQLLPLDNEYLARNDHALRAWWDTVFKGDAGA